MVDQRYSAVRRRVAYGFADVRRQWASNVSLHGLVSGHCDVQ